MSTISTAKIYLQTRPNCACNGGSTCRACLSASLLVICPPPTIDVFLSPYAASPRSGEFMDRRALLVHITHVAQSRFVLTVIHSYTTSIAYSPPPLFVQTYARNETFDRNKRKKEKSNRAAGEVRYARLIGSTFQKGKGSKKSEESIEKKEKEKEEKEEGKHRNNNNPVLQAEEVKITKKKKKPSFTFLLLPPPPPPSERGETEREKKVETSCLLLLPAARDEMSLRSAPDAHGDARIQLHVEPRHLLRIRVLLVDRDDHRRRQFPLSLGALDEPDGRAVNLDGRVEPGEFSVDLAEGRGRRDVVHEELEAAGNAGGV